jgi:hypothetical protein
MEIEINKIKYPLFFNMTAIENVMQAAGMEDFSSFGENKDLVKSLKFSRDCAFYGLRAGCKKNKINFPFATSEELGDEIESFENLNPAVEAFTKAVGDFFQVKSQE